MVEISDDKFWRTTSSVAFNFDEEEDDANLTSNSGQLFDNNTDSVFDLVLEENAVLPIHSVISKRGLDTILQDLNLPLQYNVPPIEETVKKLFLRIPCVLDKYRTLEQKIELLNKACDTFDGDVILKVVLYLAKTLQVKLLHYYISKKRIALQHYCIYLAQERKYEELFEVYMSNGSTKDLSNLFYLPCYKVLNQVSSEKKLPQEVIAHLSSAVSECDRNTLVDFQKFTSWQLSKNMSCVSVIEHLALLLKEKLERNKSFDEVTEFRNIMKISDFQYEWVQLNAMAAMCMWDKLTDLFIKPNLFKKNVIRTVISPEILLNTLHKHDAPTKTLQDFLVCISDSEKSLQLGKKMQCHWFVIDKLTENRDRVALIEYKKYLPSQSEEFFHLEKNLCADKRWKN